MMLNELYVQWLKEWMDKAYDMQSKGYQTLRKAHDSMKACPIEIGHPSLAAQLHGIGPVLCARLEKCLVAHCKETGMAMPQRPSEKRADDSNEDHAEAPVKKKRAVKAYVPAYRGGPYALLMGLTDPAARETMTKTELVRLSQPHCDASFEVASDQRSFYTAWNSIKTLIEKDLVQKRGNPPKYSITDAGADIAARMRATPDPSKLVRANNAAVAAVMRPSQSQQTDSDAEIALTEQETQTPVVNIFQHFEAIIVPAGSFKIQLVIDNREVNSPKDKSFIDDQLFRAGIELNARTLEVGDALWIAKCKDGREFVLDHIVERKRMDDLVASIKDGRYEEQKFRLKRCGARNVIFVVEDTNLAEVSFYQEAIQTALSSTQVVNGFFVKRVPSLDYTIRYLVRLNRKLAAFYESKDLHVLPDHMIDSRTFTALLEHLQVEHPGRKYYMSYEAFSGLTVKSGNFLVGDVWLRMLMCIRGVSTEKAVEIQSKFPTLHHLLKAYAACPDQSARDKLMNTHCCGYGRKTIGMALSKKIASMFE